MENKKPLTTDTQLDQIRQAIKNRKNILVVGQIGSGKSALLTQIANETAAAFPAERITFLCDEPEKTDAIFYDVTVLSPTSDVNVAYRYASSGIYVDELRGSEALSVLEGWRTGHFGGATIQGDSIDQGVSHLKSLAKKSPHAPSEVEQIVDEFLGMVILMENSQGTIQIKEIQVAA